MANPGADLIFGAGERGLAGVPYEQLFTEEDRAIGTMQTELAIASDGTFRRRPLALPD